MTPADAAKYATLAVSMAEKLEGSKLDYSPNSLKSVDEIILKFHMAGKKPEDMQRTIIVLGCYVGEVMIRNLGGKWEMPNEKASLDAPRTSELAPNTSRTSPKPKKTAVLNMSFAFCVFNNPIVRDKKPNNFSPERVFS